MTTNDKALNVLFPIDRNTLINNNGKSKRIEIIKKQNIMREHLPSLFHCLCVYISLSTCVGTSAGEVQVR